MKKQFLTGRNIYLRPIEESDLTENYQQWFNDEEVCKYNSHHRFPNYRQDMDQYYNDVIKSKNNLILAIIVTETDEHIGNISLQDINQIDKTAELAIVIGQKNYWGKGLGKEAAGLIVKHGFEQLNLNRIYCGTLADNVGMQKLAESIGFKKEGVRRQCLYKNGNYQDGFDYGLLRSDYGK